MIMTNPNPMSTSSQGTTMPIEPAAETSATIEESKTSANVDTNDLGVVAKDSSMDSLSDCISKFKTPITSAIQTTTLPVSLVDDALHVRIGAFLLIIISLCTLSYGSISDWRPIIWFIFLLIVCLAGIRGTFRIEPMFLTIYWSGLVFAVALFVIFMGWYLHFQPPRAFASDRCTDDVIATFNKTSNPCDEDYCTTMCLNAVEIQLWLEIAGISTAGGFTLLLMALHCYRFLYRVSPYLVVDNSSDTSEVDENVDMQEANQDAVLQTLETKDDDSDSSDEEDEKDSIDLVPIPQVRRRLLHTLGS